MIDHQDFEKPDAVGSIDRIVTNVGLAILASIPTMGAAIATPWVITPLIAKEDPDGREGQYLSPGVYFLMSLTVVMLIIALLVPEGADQSNTAFIGPTLALSVLDAVSAGDVWKTLSVIAPVYLMALLVGALSFGFRPIAGAWWSIRVSLRASFYIVATLVNFIAISTLAIDTLYAATGSRELLRTFYAFNTLPISLLSMWMAFWFHRRGGNVSTIRAAGLSVLTFIILFVTVWLMTALAGEI